jgi:hypothetical protein
MRSILLALEAAKTPVAERTFPCRMSGECGRTPQESPLRVDLASPEGAFCDGASEPERFLEVNQHAAVAAAIDTSSGSYHLGEVAGALVLALCVAVVVWKLVASISSRRDLKRLRMRPMAYAAVPSGPDLAAQPPGWNTILPLNTQYAEPVIMPTRREPSRGYWIPAAVIVTVAACGLIWQLVSPHGVSVPTGTGVSPAAATAEPPSGPGQVYRSTDGHFAVRFLGQPVELNNTATDQALTLSFHTAADRPHGSVVQGIDLSPGVPGGETDNFLRALVAAANLNGGTITGEFGTTFRGRPAYEADYVQNGRTLTMEAVLYGSERSYVFVAPSGPTFDALTGSFVALP